MLRAANIIGLGLHTGLVTGRPVERKGRSELSEVRAVEGESFENLLKRFNRRIQQSGILREIKKRQHFEPPSIRRKKKEAAKRRKSRRNS